MNRIIPAGCLAALFLAGCNSPSQHTPVPRNYGAASDVAVTRHTQYTLWDKGVFSGQLPVSTGSHLLTANSDRLSFDWEGDAIELLNELARVRGMQFNYNGVRLPLPVSATCLGDEIVTGRDGLCRVDGYWRSRRGHHRHCAAR